MGRSGEGRPATASLRRSLAAAPSPWAEGSWPPRTAGERPDARRSSPFALTMSHHFGNKVVMQANLRKDKPVQPHGRRTGGTDREVT